MIRPSPPRNSKGSYIIGLQTFMQKLLTRVKLFFENNMLSVFWKARTDLKIGCQKKKKTESTPDNWLISGILHRASYRTSKPTNLSHAIHHYCWSHGAWRMHQGHYRIWYPVSKCKQLFCSFPSVSIFVLCWYDDDGLVKFWKMNETLIIETIINNEDGREHLCSAFAASDIWY